MHTKSPFLSKTILGIILVATAFFWSFFTGKPVPEELVTEIPGGFVIEISEHGSVGSGGGGEFGNLIQMVIGVAGMLLAIVGRASAKGPLRMPGVPGRLSVSGIRIRAYMWGVMIPIMLIIGCSTTPTQQKVFMSGEVGEAGEFPLQVETDGIAHATTAVQSPAGTLMVHGPTQQHYATFGAEGMEIWSPVPAGAAFIGQSGAALSDPKNSAVGHVSMEFSVAIVPEGSTALIYASHVEATDLNTDLSTVIREQAAWLDQWKQVMVKLYETDQAKFAEQMATIRAVSPDAADVLMSFLGIPGF